MDEKRSVLDGLKEEGYRPPGLASQVLPWLLAAGILALVFRNIRFEDFMARLAGASIGWTALSVFLFTVVYAAGDAFSAGYVYRRFLAPGMSARDVLASRLGAFLLHVFYTPLFTAANLAYLKRRLRAPIIGTLSANGFTVAHDFFAINLVLTGGLLANLFTRAVPELDPRWLIGCGAIWAVGAGYAVYWFTPVRDVSFLGRVTGNPILLACRQGKVSDSAIMVLIRLAVALVGVAAHWAALEGFGIHAPAPLILTAAPLMIAVSFLPVSSAGFGGPQLVALILLPYAGGDAALVSAYSVAFSALFTAFRSMIGAAFLPSFIKGLRSPVEMTEAQQ